MPVKASGVSSNPSSKTTTVSPMDVLASTVASLQATVNSNMIDIGRQGGLISNINQSLTHLSTNINSMLSAITSDPTAGTLALYIAKELQPLKTRLNALEAFESQTHTRLEPLENSAADYHSFKTTNLEFIDSLHTVSSHELSELLQSLKAHNYTDFISQITHIQSYLDQSVAPAIEQFSKDLSQVFVDEKNTDGSHKISDISQFCSSLKALSIVLYTSYQGMVGAINGLARAAGSTQDVLVIPPDQSALFS